jgi:hypothetical protein
VGQSGFQNDILKSGFAKKDLRISKCSVQPDPARKNPNPAQNPAQKSGTPNLTFHDDVGPYYDGFEQI